MGPVPGQTEKLSSIPFLAFMNRSLVRSRQTQWDRMQHGWVRCINRLNESRGQEQSILPRKEQGWGFRQV